MIDGTIAHPSDMAQFDSMAAKYKFAKRTEKMCEMILFPFRIAAHQLEIQVCIQVFCGCFGCFQRKVDQMKLRMG